MNTQLSITEYLEGLTDVTFTEQLIVDGFAGVEALVRANLPECCVAIAV